MARQKRDAITYLTYPLVQLLDRELSQGCVRDVEVPLSGGQLTSLPGLELVPVLCRPLAVGGNPRPPEVAPHAGDVSGLYLGVVGHHGAGPVPQLRPGWGVGVATGDVVPGQESGSQ